VERQQENEGSSLEHTFGFQDIDEVQEDAGVQGRRCLREHMPVVLAPILMERMNF
jgi:hypothetical protein